MAGLARDITTDVEANRIAELTEQVADLFKEYYRRGPWPNDTQCYPLAVLIGVIRNNKSYKEDFKRENRSLRERRTVVAAMKRLVKEQQNLGPAISLQDKEDLEALAALLESPALLQPSDPLAGQRDKAWWHKAARLIAKRALIALVQAGHKKAEISFQGQGHFVSVVAAALKLATGIDFEPETIAHVISSTNSLEVSD